MKLKIILNIIIFVSIFTSLIGIVIIDRSKYNEKQIRKGKQIIIFSIIIIIFFFLIKAFVIKFFPFINKVDSFVTLYMMILFIIVFYLEEFNSEELTVFFIFALLSGVTATIFKDSLSFPSPALRTIWFPLHVPLSFLAYAFWIACGVKSFIIYMNDEKDSEIILKFNRYGFIAFSLSMIFGGIWGYFAWGAYFMWDPKILWSAILWLYYGNLLHIDMVPSYKKYKHVLYAFGIIIIVITFIGTSFFSRSIHRF